MKPKGINYLEARYELFSDSIELADRLSKIAPLQDDIGDTYYLNEAAENLRGLHQLCRQALFAICVMEVNK